MWVKKRVFCCCRNLIFSSSLKKIGLVDEVAADKAEAVAKCESFLGEFRKIAPQARALTKQMLRKAELMALEENRKQDMELFVFAVNQKKTQAGLEVYMQSLKKK